MENTRRQLLSSWPVPLSTKQLATQPSTSPSRSSTSPCAPATQICKSRPFARRNCHSDRPKGAEESAVASDSRPLEICKRIYAHDSVPDLVSCYRLRPE